MRGERDYERPLIEPDNLMTGGFQSGRFDASPRASTGREASIWALIFAAVWLLGIGSIVAIGFAVLALSSGDIGARHRRCAITALVLAAVGLAAMAAILVRA